MFPIINETMLDKEGDHSYINVNYHVLVVHGHVLAFIFVPKFWSWYLLC
jgi:hypothetical protein